MEKDSLCLKSLVTTLKILIHEFHSLGVGLIDT
nr:MAG TPA_asm: hypothetical protein [Caudoviricetes sp.]